MSMPSFQQHGFSLSPGDFRQELQGQLTDLWILANDLIAVAFTNYGARIVGLITKDKQGQAVDVVLGFGSLQEYIDTTEVYHGAIIGRYANRIARGKFSLEGKAYQLPVNNGRNHLHGGPGGFHNAIWKLEEQTSTSISFSYHSPDGEEGYPGALTVRVKYEIIGNALKIVFYGITDAPTIVNLANHAYFNLNGDGQITGHRLRINADQFTPIDEYYIPTGVLDDVGSTPFDFRLPVEIGRRIHDDDIQLRNGGGYDHNFVLNKDTHHLSEAATVTGDRSGITLQVLTTEPGIQLYTGNFMHGEFELKDGRKDEYRTAFCLETQHFPDSPNQPAFPSVVLRPGERYFSETVFSFSASSEW